jgi:hypothetical protein
MRGLLVVLSMISGCGGSNPPARPIAASGSAAPAKPMCYPATERGHQITAFVVAGERATLCIHNQHYNDPKPREEYDDTCGSVDLTTGKFVAEAARPVDGDEAPEWKIEEDATSVRACRKGSCVVLELPPGTYDAAVNADGTRAAATGGALDGVAVFDLPAGKRTATLRSDNAAKLVEPRFLGDTLYAIAADGRGFLFARDGTRIAILDGHSAGFRQRDVPYRVRGDVWLFDHAESMNVVNVKTGESQVIEMEMSSEGTSGIGIWRDGKPGTTASGKIVVVHLGRVTLVDPTTAKVVEWPIPPCTVPVPMVYPPLDQP